MILWLGGKEKIIDVESDSANTSWKYLDKMFENVGQTQHKYFPLHFIANKTFDIPDGALISDLCQICDQNSFV